MRINTRLSLRAQVQFLILDRRILGTRLHTNVVYVTVDQNPIPSLSPDMGMGLVDGLGLGLLTPPLTATDEGAILVLLPSPPLCTASVEVWSLTLEVPVAVCLPGVGDPGWLVPLLTECPTVGRVWALVISSSLGPSWSSHLS